MTALAGQSGCRIVVDDDDSDRPVCALSDEGLQAPLEIGGTVARGDDDADAQAAQGGSALPRCSRQRKRVCQVRDEPHPDDFRTEPESGVEDTGRQQLRDDVGKPRGADDAAVMLDCHHADRRLPPGDEDK